MKINIEYEEFKKKANAQKRKLETEIKMLYEEKAGISNKMNKIKKKVVKLEIENESYIDKHRINEEIIQDMKNKGENLFEKMTILQMESETIKNLGDEKVQRIKEKLKETEEEMICLKKKRNNYMVHELMEDHKDKGGLSKIKLGHTSGDLKMSHSLERSPSKKNNVSKNHKLSNFASKKIKLKKKVRNKKRRENFESNNMMSEKNISKFMFSKKKKGLKNKNTQSRKNLRVPNKVNKGGNIFDNVGEGQNNEWFYNFICSLDQKLKNIKHNLDTK